ncbi:hypothetical protein DFS34DRAFT_686719 [Phlyctochytrium arcticum]|nr:hypothetical protein DFS34DRAFT_686719 [Phlyctochytrium arcticum]
MTSIDAAQDALLKERDRNAFAQLRGICVQAMDPGLWAQKLPTSSNPLIALHREVDKVGATLEGRATLYRLEAYITFPLLQILQYPASSPLQVEQALNCLLSLISLWKEDIPVGLVWNLLRAIPISALRLNEKHEKSVHLEEVAFLSAKCCNLLIPFWIRKSKNAPVGVEQATEPQIAALVLMLLQLVELDTRLETRLEAIGAILQLIQRMNEGGSYNIKQFLPGVSSAITRTVLKSDTVPSLLVERCLQLLSDVIVLSFSDVDDSLKSGALAKTETELGRHDDVWFQTTRARLCDILIVLHKLRNRLDWRVKLGYLHLTKTIVLRCRENLSGIIPLLLEAIFGLVDQSDAVVLQEEWHKVLSHIRQEMAQVPSLKMLIQEVFYQFLLNLPSRVKTGGDKHKMETFRIAVGFLTLLEDNSEASVRIRWTETFSSLIWILSMDLTARDAVVESRSPHLDENGSTFAKLPFPFLHFLDYKLFCIVQNFCQLLGAYANPNFMVNDILQHCKDRDSFKPQALLILNSIIVGAQRGSTSHTEPAEKRMRGLLRSVAAEMTDHWTLSEPITRYSMDNSSGSQISSQLKRSSILSEERSDHFIEISKILILQTLQTLAQALRDDFRPILANALYIFLENIGCSDYWVAEHAKQNLALISIFLGYDQELDKIKLNPSQNLVLSNADYVLDSISRRLHSNDPDHRCTWVLRAIVAIGKADVIPLLTDSVDDMLETLEDSHLEHLGVITSFLDALLAIVQAASADLSTANPGPNTAAPSTSLDKPLMDQSPTASLEVQAFVLKYSNSSKNISSDPTECDAFDSAPLSDDSQPSPAGSLVPNACTIDAKQLCLSLVAKIARCVINFLAAAHPSVRKRSLCILNESLPVLALKKEELNKVIHDQWTVLLNRLEDREHFVVMEAISLGINMLQSSPDFLMKRFGDEFLPRLCSALPYLRANIQHHNGSQTSQISKSTKILQHLFSVLATGFEPDRLSPRRLAQLVDSILPFCYNEDYQNCIPEIIKLLHVIARSPAGADILWLRVGSSIPNGVSSFSGTPCSFPEWMEQEQGRRALLAQKLCLDSILL